MTYIIKTKIKEYIKSKDLNYSRSCDDVLDLVLLDLVDKACNRAKANGRVTLQGKDF